MTQEAVSKANIRCTAIDVISREYAEDVKKVLRTMLGRENIDYSQADAWEQRTAACKTVLDVMAPAEREKVHEKVKNYKKNGLPSDIQRM